MLARAIGCGAGVMDPMPSPSYNLLLRYKTSDGGIVSHLDLYRIESPDDVWELGWSELGTECDVVLVEWPERAAELMPTDYWLISLDMPDDQPLLRDVEVQSVGRPPELPGFPFSVAVSG